MASTAVRMPSMGVIEFFACGHIKMRGDLEITTYLSQSRHRNGNLGISSVIPMLTRKPELSEPPNYGHISTIFDTSLPLEKALHLFSLTACPQIECQGLNIRGVDDVTCLPTQLPSVEILANENKTHALMGMLSQNELQFVDIIFIVDCHPEGMRTACPWYPEVSFGQVLRKLEIDMDYCRNLLDRLERSIHLLYPAFMVNTLYSIAAKAMERLRRNQVDFEFRLRHLKVVTSDRSSIVTPFPKYTEQDLNNWYLVPPQRCRRTPNPPKQGQYLSKFQSSIREREAKISETHRKIELERVPKRAKHIGQKRKLVG